MKIQCILTQLFALNLPASISCRTRSFTKDCGSTNSIQVPSQSKQEMVFFLSIPKIINIISPPYSVLVALLLDTAGELSVTPGVCAKNDWFIQFSAFDFLRDK
ncbi:hypothetical protein CDAR_460091 [Caerostris darwini]|uniref:Uncharacterized protein n=1 Tax=Caerostris darwini TaxID=1538125 RepID=A0AAV4WUZ8_9ARAC|nr:hypothetical protein CDAR_460091 [Caerostris darwini]